MRIIASLACLLLCGALETADAAGGHRVALVIGNAEYQHTSRLKNPVNDAADIAVAFERLGFDVVRGIDLDYGAMREQIRRFIAKLPGSEVAIFYYAGHGLQLGGKNFLIPVDSQLKSEFELDFSTVDLDLVVRNMEREPRINIVFLDACRDNALTNNLARNLGTRSSASVGRGLARVESGVGTLIAFATQPGNVAVDGQGRNSPFTAALLQTIERPGQTIGELMISVRNAVLRDTGGKQVPWEHSSLTGQFYFVPPVKPAETPPVAAPAPVTREGDPASVEIAFWNTIKDSRNPRLFEAYLLRYPSGAFATLAKISLEEFKLAALKPDHQDEKQALSDPGLLREIRDRLYELNFDPGSLDGPMTDAARQAIRSFESLSNQPQTGEPTNGLLRRLREVGGLKPWGAIVYAQGSEKWGMAWAHQSRKEAVASARASCGQGAKCATEISFFGTECGAFAHSGGPWSIVARSSASRAKDDALAECRKRGKNCRIIAAVCADGAERIGVN